MNEDKKIPDDWDEYKKIRYDWMVSLDIPSAPMSHDEKIACVNDIFETFQNFFTMDSPICKRDYENMKEEE